MSTEEIYQYLSTIILSIILTLLQWLPDLLTELILNPNFETLDVPKVACLWAKELIQLMQEKFGICLIKSSYAIDQVRCWPTPKCKSKSLFYFDFSQRKLLRTFENNHKIEQWVQNGGTLIAYQDAIKWLNTAKLIELTLKQIKMKLKH
jgi:hypothetical protein